MKRQRKVRKSLGEQVVDHARKKPKEKKEQEGNFNTIISTGSTLLNLAISGSRVHGGGLCSGILVEIFGPSGSGKTVLLSEIAGYVQRSGGEIMFHDPEARLNKQFARMFDLDVNNMNYSTPDKIPQVFNAIRKWDINEQVVNGIFTDSLAALSTDMEMENEDGDKMGMRRAKEFSEELRRTCRIIKNKNLLMIASNQVRVNQTAGPYGQKYISPGGEAIAFYSSLRLRSGSPTKIKEKKTYKGKTIEKVVGIEVDVEVFKSSIDTPYRKAPLIIYFNYGIDDIRANLQYVKTYTGENVYMINDFKAGRSLDEAVSTVEKNELEEELKEQVIEIWNAIENKFEKNRKKKIR